MITIVIGIIQALTEFLPISSSAHIFFLMKIFNYNIDAVFFQIALHFGTLCAIIIYFRNEIIEIFRNFLKSFKNTSNLQFEHLIGWYILASSLPAGVIGFFFEDIIKNLFYNLYSISIALVIGGILLLLAEKYFSQKLDFNKITLKKALIIGTAQVIALIPGVSRSGITIIAGLSLKLKREVAAKFSFLMVTPIIFGAALKQIIDAVNFGMNQNEFMGIFLGFLSSFIAGYICIKYFLQYVAKHSFKIFAYYRFVFAILIIVYSIIF